MRLYIIYDYRGKDTYDWTTLRATPDGSGVRPTEDQALSYAHSRTFNDIAKVGGEPARASFASVVYLN